MIQPFELQWNGILQLLSAMQDTLVSKAYSLVSSMGMAYQSLTLFELKV
jgi:hypothetical protein